MLRTFKTPHRNETYLWKKGKAIGVNFVGALRMSHLCQYSSLMFISIDCSSFKSLFGKAIESVTNKTCNGIMKTITLISKHKYISNPRSSKASIFLY